MYQYRDGESEYWADNYDVDGMDEDMQEDLSGRVMGETGFEDEYYGVPVCFLLPCTIRLVWLITARCLYSSLQFLYNLKMKWGLSHV